MQSRPKIFDVLSKIEKGEITISMIDDADDIYCGNVQYQASNGWLFTIFNDCDYFDYIDRIEYCGELIHDFGTGDEEVDKYVPNQKVEKEIWHLNKNRPYHAEEWVKCWQQNADHTGMTLKCEICGEDGSFIYQPGMTTLQVDDKMIAFSEKHYSCNPIYGPQIIP